MKAAADAVAAAAPDTAAKRRAEEDAEKILDYVMSGSLEAERDEATIVARLVACVLEAPPPRPAPEADAAAEARERLKSGFLFHKTTLVARYNYQAWLEEGSLAWRRTSGAGKQHRRALGPETRVAREGPKAVHVDGRAFKFSSPADAAAFARCLEAVAGAGVANPIVASRRRDAHV
eukprot:CAMPEP_0119295066 /NCGR_PEP_ID=MMETSP1329-20130426/49166_1 /TAXON_ID=114041 /ORGANISM="Genus nov. species nov., Strain RCC1024" /LENGTH=176 /DNA_ID=CAMNT_0007295977 /DNA_START=74 /DNA_END=601 /DNA_ORIENTATION=-